MAKAKISKLIKSISIEVLYGDGVETEDGVLLKSGHCLTITESSIPVSLYKEISDLAMARLSEVVSDYTATTEAKLKYGRQNKAL